MTKNTLMAEKTIYPTKWKYGKSKGSVVEYQSKAYRAVIPLPNKDIRTRHFNFYKYNSKNNALKAAQDWLYNESKKHNVLTNEIRYLNKDTIEVKLTMDKTLKTDAKFLDTVQQYDLCTKRKKTKNGYIYYAHYRDGRTTYPFNKLISDIEHIKFINGNPLDNRSCNMTNTDLIIKDNKENISGNSDKQYDYFNMNVSNLPKNEWLLGKPVGTVFKRKGDTNWTAVVKSPDKKFARTFHTEQEAKKWQINTSYILGLTKNLIKIIDNDTIKIFIKEDSIMKTDLKHLELVQKYPLFLMKGSNQTNYFVGISDNGKNKLFHKMIVDYDKTYYKDGNTLNNCANNLSNKPIIDILQVKVTDDKINRIKYMGVYYYKDKCAWVSKLKIDGKTYCSFYSIKKYGFYEAREMALLHRMIIYQLHDSKNGKYYTINKTKLTKDKIGDIHKYINDLRNRTFYSIDSIPSDLWEINPKLNKKIIFDKYLLCKMKYYEDYYEILKLLKEKSALKYEKSKREYK